MYVKIYTWDLVTTESKKTYDMDLNSKNNIVLV